MSLPRVLLLLLAATIPLASADEFPSDLCDGRLLSATYIAVRSGQPAALEVHWPEPRVVRQLIFDFLVYDGDDFAPHGETRLELLAAGAWRAVAATPETDWSGAETWAPAQRMGRVRWIYTLPGESVDGARLTFSRGRENTVVCCEVEISQALRWNVRPAATSPHSPLLPEDVNLLRHVAHTLDFDDRALQLPAKLLLNTRSRRLRLRFPSPRMLSRIELRTNDSPPPATLQLRLAGKPLRLGEATREALGWSFFPRAVDEVDVLLSAPRTRAIRLDDIYAGTDAAGQRTLAAIRDATEDLWAWHLLSLGEPNYTDSASLMRPRRDFRTVIGASGDIHETAITWNGVHLLRRNDDPAADQYSRFFAFRLDGEMLGDDMDRLTGGWTSGRRVLSPGSLPERWLRYENEGVRCSVRSFTALQPSGESAHRLYIEVILENEASKVRRGVLEILTGRVHWGKVARLGIINQRPLDDAVTTRDGQLLLDRGGRPVLWSDTPFVLAAGGAESACRFDYALAPRRSRRIALRAVVDAPREGVDLSAPPELSEARETFRRWWERKTSSGMRISVPEPRLVQTAPRFLADCLIIPDAAQPRYGAYFYEDTFGVEEGWPALALARWGLAADAEPTVLRLLEMAARDHITRHLQYRKGLAPTYAWGVYELSRDRDFLLRALPAMRACADEIVEACSRTRVLHGGERVGYYGLLPRFYYGGDVAVPAYGIYGNACAWRGLRDTGLACREIGDASAAAAYLREAEEFRTNILRALDRVMDTESDPPFVPFSLGYDSADPDEPFPAGDPTPERLACDTRASYWGLFAGLMLETRLFAPQSHYTDSILATLEERGGLWAGQARFYYDDHDWDPHYGYGVRQAWFERGQRDRFLLGFYGFLANNLSRDTWVHAEVGNVFPLRVGNFAPERAAKRKVWRQPSYKESEPIGSGAALLLCELRDMLVCEGRDDAGLVDGRLHLLRNAPGAWLASEKEIAVERAPTAFGRVSYRLIADWGKRRATLQIERDSDTPVPVRLHLRLPEDASLVEVNWRDAEPTGQGTDWCEARVEGRARCDVRW